MTWHPALSSIERKAGLPRHRPRQLTGAQRREAAPTTIGTWDHCWCARELQHDWPGKAAGQATSPRGGSMNPSEPMTQAAPDPRALRDLVGQLDYKGWNVYLADLDRGQGSKGLTLVITRAGPDACHPERVIRVNHYMPVPPAAFNRASWQRWLFEQFLLVERHECAEYFRIGGERPYAPNHGNGEDPYIIHDPTTGEARRTSFRNVLDDDGTGRPKRM